MYRNKTFNRKKVMIVFVAVFFIMMFLIGRLVYLMIFCSEYYGNKAENLHERERDIKAARGKLLDANGTVLATNKSVCTISVIHNQIEEPGKVIEMLVRELGIPGRDCEKARGESQFHRACENKCRKGDRGCGQSLWTFRGESG